MNYSILNQGNNHRRSVKALSSSLANQEEGRNRTNDAIDSAESAQRKNTLGTAAGYGARYAVKKAGEGAAVDALKNTTAETVGREIARETGTAVATDAIGATTAESLGTAIAAETGTAVATDAAATAIATEAATAGTATAASGAASGAKAGAMLGPWGLVAFSALGLIASGLF